MRLFKKVEPNLSLKQFERLSNIFDNASQVFLGVAVLTPIIGGINILNIRIVISGIIAVIVCWIASLILSKKR